MSQMQAAMSHMQEAMSQMQEEALHNHEDAMGAVAELRCDVRRTAHERRESDTFLWATPTEGQGARLTERARRVFVSSSPSPSPPERTLSTCTVMGKVGQGKSFLLNCLSKAERFFVTDSVVEHGTEGTRIATSLSPLETLRFTRSSDTPMVLFADTRGLGDVGQTADVEATLPVLLLSRVCIVNIMSGGVRVPTNDVLNDLVGLVEAAERVNDLSQTELHVVLRDRAEQDTEAIRGLLLDTEVSAQGSDAATRKGIRERNHIRQRLESSFACVHVWCLPNAQPIRTRLADGATPVDGASEAFQIAFAPFASAIYTALATPMRFNNLQMTVLGFPTVAEGIASKLHAEDMDGIYEGILDALHRHRTDQAKAVADAQCVQAKESCLASNFDASTSSSASSSTSVFAAFATVYTTFVSAVQDIVASGGETHVE